MPKKTRPLSDTEIKSSKPKEKIYSLYDSEGLELRITPAGSKSWLFRYRRPFTLKTNCIKLGSYPELSLSSARKTKLKYREMLSTHVDPQAWLEHQKKNQIFHLNNTLEKVALEWFNIKFSKISDRYASNFRRTFELYIFPMLGHYPINDLTAPLLIRCLKPLEAANKIETLSRLCQRINELMTWCVNTGLLPHNTLTGIKAAFTSPSSEHMPTIKPGELPTLMRRISMAQIKLQTRYLIEFQLHTMVRPSEAAGARWDEIDLQKQEWTLPGSRMKQKKQHVIPLTPQVLQLLKNMMLISGHSHFVFPSTRHLNTHTHAETVNRALQRMGYKGILVSHGFRALASTILNEKGFNSDVIEKALSHTEKNTVRQAYNRAEYLPQRRKMLKWWSEHIEKASMGSVALSAK